MVAVSLKKNFFKQKTAYEITTRLVGSEMCIRDRYTIKVPEWMKEYRVLKLILQPLVENSIYHGIKDCLLYTSDAADD